MSKVEYWLFNSEQLKAYREWAERRREIAEKLVMKYDRLYWDVTDQLERTEMDEYKTEQWLKDQSDKTWDDDSPTS